MIILYFNVPMERSKTVTIGMGAVKIHLKMIKIRVILRCSGNIPESFLREIA